MLLSTSTLFQIGRPVQLSARCSAISKAISVAEIVKRSAKDELKQAGGAPNFLESVGGFEAFGPFDPRKTWSWHLFSG